MRISSAFVLASLLLVASPGAGLAQTLKPFSKVPSVGPSRTPGYDKIVLKNGETVLAQVVAENPMFYVLERFGEYRAVGKDQVASLERNKDLKREEGHVDQILCKNGHVLSGKIVTERPDGMVEMKQANQSVSQGVWKSEIVAIFKDGKKTFPAP